jgi:hypothetical protein
MPKNKISPPLNALQNEAGIAINAVETFNKKVNAKIEIPSEAITTASV